MLRVILLAGLTLAASAGSVLAQEGAMKPGYWKVTNQISAVFSKTSQELRCLSPSDIAKFMSGPSNRHYDCNYPTRRFEDGKITLAGHCVDKYGKKAEVLATGAYSPIAFSLHAKVAASYAGLPIHARFTTEAKRIGDVCPVGAAKG